MQNRREFLRSAGLLGAVCAAGGCATTSAGALSSGMLHGRVADSAPFESLHPRFRKALRFLREHDLAKLALGRHEIDGDAIFANVQDATLTPWDVQAKLEVHRKYIDIQVPVSGVETFGYIRDEANVRAHAADFDVTKDYVLFTNPAMGRLTVAPGEFIVFMPPYGAHAPCHCAGAKPVTPHRKIVVKVLL